MKALVSLTEDAQFDRTISYHTAGNIIYWYFGQQGSFYDVSRQFAETIAAATGYPLDDSRRTPDPAGYKDWAISKMNITIEVGEGDSPLACDELEDIYDRSQNVIEETIVSILHKNAQ